MLGAGLSARCRKSAVIRTVVAEGQFPTCEHIKVAALEGFGSRDRRPPPRVVARKMTDRHWEQTVLLSDANAPKINVLLFPDFWRAGPRRTAGFPIGLSPLAFYRRKNSRHAEQAVLFVFVTAMLFKASSLPRIQRHRRAAGIRATKHEPREDNHQTRKRQAAA